MASLVSDVSIEEVIGVTPEARAPSGVQKPWVLRVSWWRGAVLAIATFYFLVPLYAAAKFAFQDTNGDFSFVSVKAITSQAGITDALWFSSQLAVITLVITLGLMVPTAVFVHLRLPKVRPAMELITLLPIVFPPIVLIIGVLKVSPMWLRNWQYMLALLYVILAMPFVYRSLDAGLRAIDVKTLVEASRSLGGRWAVTVWRVLLPNLTSAMVSAVVLTLALVFGEFTLAYIAQWNTFPVWLNGFYQTDGHITVAVSMLGLIVTWLLLALIVLIDLIRTSRVTKRRVSS